MAQTAALDMSLEEVIGAAKGSRGKAKGKGTGGAKASSKANKGGNKGRANASAAGSVSGKKLDMALEDVIDNEQKSKGVSKDKGKAQWNNGGADDWNSSRGRKGGPSAVSGGKGGWGKPSGGGMGGKRGNGDWSGGGTSLDGWQPPWNEHDDRDSASAGVGKGKGDRRGKSRDDSRRGDTSSRDFSRNSLWGGSGAKGVRAEDGWTRVPARGGDNDRGEKNTTSARSGGSGLDRVRRGEDPPATRGWSGAASTGTRDRRARSRDDDRNSRGTAARSGGVAGGQKRRNNDDDDRRTKRIKVTNVPRDLDMKDIQDAFEGETGRILQCELSGSTARIVFSRADDALKAVDAFDRGELNGKRITVTLEP